MARPTVNSDIPWYTVKELDRELGFDRDEFKQTVSRMSTQQLKEYLVELTYDLGMFKEKRIELGMRKRLHQSKIATIRYLLNIRLGLTGFGNRRKVHKSRWKDYYRYPIVSLLNSGDYINPHIKWGIQSAAYPNTLEWDYTLFIRFHPVGIKDVKRVFGESIYQRYRNVLATESMSIAGALCATGGKFVFYDRFGLRGGHTKLRNRYFKQVYAICHCSEVDGENKGSTDVQCVENTGETGFNNECLEPEEVSCK